MKKVFFIPCLSLAFSIVFGQKILKDPSAGVQIGLLDFKAAQSSPQEIKLALGLSFVNGISNHVDYSVNLYGASLKYPYRKKAASDVNQFLFELDASIHLKLSTDNHIAVPYFFSGLGASLYDSQLEAFVPVGAGLQFRLGKGIFLLPSVQYRIPLTGNANYHFVYGLGILSAIKFRQATAGATVGVTNQKVDTDKDGIVDGEDSCVTIPGIATYKGCPIPDSDSDGIIDPQDNCPFVAGILKYLGCPIPDTDEDGVNDEEDRCVTIPGVRQYYGCPVPDSDNDSLNDEMDKCPFNRGPISNGGCPLTTKDIQEKLDSAARFIFFETGKAVLKPKSLTILAGVVQLLEVNTAIHLKIEGHTDNVGSDVSNKKLSQNRAIAVLNYLAGKGIGKKRLSSKGFGASKPITTNSTSAGRTTNRRVELVITQ